MAADTSYETLRELLKPHIESFDYFIEEGLEKAIMSIQPVQVYDSSRSETLRIWFGKSSLSSPHKKTGPLEQPLYPFECRQGGLTYQGKFGVEVCFQWNDGRAVVREKFHFGSIPIMLRSKLCHLRNAGPQELVRRKEEMTEMGG